ncbi:MAG: family 1 glycosylhydrolase, partial [Lentisphaerota bacterium]
WTDGYTRRFGLIHVDHKTQKRTLKDSSKLYREIIRQNGANITGVK